MIECPIQDLKESSIKGDRMTKNQAWSPQNPFAFNVTSGVKRQSPFVQIRGRDGNTKRVAREDMEKAKLLFTEFVSQMDEVNLAGASWGGRSIEEVYEVSLAEAMSNGEEWYLVCKEKESSSTSLAIIDFGASMRLKVKEKCLRQSKESISNQQER